MQTLQDMKTDFRNTDAISSERQLVWCQVRHLTLDHRTQQFHWERLGHWVLPEELEAMQGIETQVPPWLLVQTSTKERERSWWTVVGKEHAPFPHSPTECSNQCREASISMVAWSCSCTGPMPLILHVYNQLGSTVQRISLCTSLTLSWDG